MRKFLAFILYYIFLPKIKREMKRTDCVLSIYGHNPSAKSFRHLIEWLLKHGYSFLTIEELSDYLEGKPLKTTKNVWLSFDDGWKSNYINVFPVLKEYQISATIFIATKGILDGYFWFDKAFQNRESKYYNEIQELWDMPNSKRVEIVSKLNIHLNERLTMTSSELLEMTESGLIHWGNHTHDHVMSDHCEKVELINEISTCSDFINKWTGQKADFIYSYPNGNKDARSERIIKNMGFSMGATTQIGYIYRNTDKYLIPRNEFKDNASLKENILQSFGLWTPFFNTIKFLLHIKNKK